MSRSQLNKLSIHFRLKFDILRFLHYEQYTAKCHGAEHALRHTCDLEGGKWVSGFDISGHTFLLIYSILVMSEEVIKYN